MLAKVENIRYSFSDSLIFLAAAGPTISAISSNDAFLIRATLLKAFNKAIFRFSPTPGILS